MMIRVFMKTNKFFFLCFILSGCLSVVNAQVISTVAGGAFVLGDGGPATAAELQFPSAVAFDPAGNILVGEQAGR